MPTLENSSTITTSTAGCSARSMSPSPGKPRLSKGRDSCGGAAEELIERAFDQHGKLAGEDAKAKEKYDLSGTPSIYKALNDYYLNGMPCDQANVMVSSEEVRIVWEADECLQEQNWKRAGVDAGTMVKLYQAWLQVFVSSANPAFSFGQLADKSDGDPVNRFEIYRGQC